MNRPDLPLYKLDFTGVSEFNKITHEYGARSETKFTEVMIPLQAPFYINSVKLFHLSGEPMVLDKDYEFYGLLSNLTEHTAKSVGLFIRLKKESIKEWYIDYQCVGNFNKLTDEILQMLKSITQDDRPIDWENIDNKPLWFIPRLHRHDYTFHFFGFTDLAKELLRVGTSTTHFPKGVQIRLETFQERLDAYIVSYQKVLYDLIDEHDKGRVDNHGVNKAEIGLDLVDNFKTATLSETADGDRSDLHVTVKNAAAAAELAGGRNQRLFPSGSLPILRYGADSFIPPKIDGSYEGMGGIYQKSGVNVENNGEMLILQRRNNGKVKGLYFVRGTRWDTDRPIWEFTGYRYNHPTAIADGANLNAILTGSNGQIMVIGDEDKKIWYWVEANGTFDPSKHVLNRISGDWLTWCHRWTAGVVLADKNYKEFNGIGLALTQIEVKSLRASFPPQGAGAREVDGWCFFANIAMDGSYRQSIVDFTVPGLGYGNFKDKAFTPGPSVFENGKITQCEFRPTAPLQELWRYQTPDIFVRKAPDGRWGLYIDYRLYWIVADTLEQGSGTHCWRGYFTVTNGTTPTLLITPGPEEKVYTVDSKNVNGPLTDPKYLYYKIAKFDYAYQSNGCSVLVGDKHRLIFRSGNGFTIPLEIRVHETTNYADGDNLSGLKLTDVEPQTSYSLVNELNPIGLGSGFMNQFYGICDTDDPSSGIIFARQVVSDLEEQKIKGNSKWVARPMDYLAPTWHGKWDNVATMTLGGKTVSHYPFVNKAYEMNIGPAIVMSTASQPDNIGMPNRKDTWTDIFGADAFSTLTGKTINRDTSITGDGLLRFKNVIKLVGNVVTYTPLIVYNVGKAILSQVPAELAKKGVSATDLAKSWSVIKCWDKSNNPFFMLVISFKVPDPGNPITDIVKLCMAPVKFVTVGSPVTKDGYQYYDDVTIQYLQPLCDPIIMFSSAIKNLSAYGIGTDPAHHSALNLTQRNSDTSSAPITLVLRTLHRYSVIGNVRCVEMALDIGPDLVIGRFTAMYRTPVNPETAYAYVFTPGFAISYIVDDQLITEGAGLCSRGFGSHSSKTLYDQLLSMNVQEMPFLGMSNLLVSSYTVYFKEIKNVILGGKSYDIPATYINLRDIDTNPANKTFYAYLKYKGGQPVYEIGLTVVPETPVSGLIAIIRCGPSQIESIIPYNRFSMVGVGVSATRQGSTIPASVGSSFDFGDTSQILQDGDFLPE